MDHEEQAREHVTHIIHEFNFARTNSEVVRNGTRLTVATVSASRRRGPDSPAARISIWTIEDDKNVSANSGFWRSGDLPLLEVCNVGILRAAYAKKTTASFQRDRLRPETEVH